MGGLSRIMQSGQEPVPGQFSGDTAPIVAGGLVRVDMEGSIYYDYGWETPPENERLVRKPSALPVSCSDRQRRERRHVFRARMPVLDFVNNCILNARRGGFYRK